MQIGIIAVEIPKGVRSIRVSAFFRHEQIVSVRVDGDVEGSDESVEVSSVSEPGNVPPLWNVPPTMSKVVESACAASGIVKARRARTARKRRFCMRVGNMEVRARVAVLKDRLQMNGWLFTTVIAGELARVRPIV